MKKSIKITACIVSLALLLQMIPTHIIAADVSDGSNSTSQTDKTQSQSTTAAPQIVGEVTDKREANVKHFMLSDGSFEAVEYQDPIHYQQDGQWKDIDNTLTEKQTASTSATNDIFSALTPNSQSQVPDFMKSTGITDSIQDGYGNKDNSFDVKFAKNASSENLVRVKSGKYQISWNLAGTATNKKSAFGLQSKTATADSNSKLTAAQKNDEKFTTLNNISSGTTYSNILSNVDLKYNLVGQSLKEYLVLKNNKSQSTFEFTYKLDNLEMRKVSDGSIEVYDPADSSTKYYIPKPVMMDKAGVASTDVTMNFKKGSDGKYTIDVIANKAWLEDSKREYPVTIDPDIQTKLEEKAIHETFVASGTPNANYTSNGMVIVGHDSYAYGACRTYLKFDLPDLGASARVTEAQLNLLQYHWSPSSFSNYQINAHNVTSPLNTDNVTWNSQPSYDPTISDYCMADGSENWRAWDITRIASNWYSTGTNDGIMVSANDENAATNIYFVSSDYYGVDSSYYPSMYINYRNTNGLEDYWTTHSQNAGRAGTGYVNDATGNVTLVENDLSESGNILPVTINHVFNNVSDINGSSQTVKYGNGWKVDAIQKILPSAIPNYPFYLIDGDGTQHYFTSNNEPSGIYIDEDGLSLTLTTPETNYDLYYKITTKDGATMIFDQVGYLSSYTDANGNMIHYNYTAIPNVDNYLSNIVDGAGRTICFNYNSSYQLTGIVDPSGRTTSYSYDGNGNLTSITYPDGKSVSYTYNGNKLASAINIDGSSISYSNYDNYNRVTRADEKGTSGEQGAWLNMSYPSMNETKFTDNLGKSETYQFNNFGNTTCVVDNNDNAAIYQYTGTAGQTNNKVTNSGQTQKTIYNNIINSGFENGLSSWYTIGSGVSTQSGGYSGNSMLKTASFSLSDTDVGTQYVSLQAGTYTLSAYVKTSNVVSGSGLGAGLEVAKSGNWAYSNFVTGTTDSSIDNGWQRVSVTFTLNPGESIQRISAGLFLSSGTAYFDCIQLESGSVANKYNLVENGSFERGSGLVPDYWSSSAITTSDGSSNNSLNDGGNRSFGINGDTLNAKCIYQTVPVSGSEGDIYSISGWAKANSVPISGGRVFSISVQVNYTDGSVSNHCYQINPYISDWQCLAETFSTDDNNSSTNKTYYSITIYCCYYYNANTAYFDGIQLTKDQGQSYVYDSKGNLVSAADASGEKTSFSNTNNELTKASDTKGTTYEYAYNSNKNITLAKSSEGVNYNFTYDSAGNALTSKIGSDAYSTSIVSGKTYYIRSKVSGQYLDLANNSNNLNTPVVQNNYTGSDTQKFEVLTTGDGYYRLVSSSSSDGKVVDYDFGTGLLSLYKNYAANTQQFKLVLNQDGSYTIETRYSNDNSSINVPNSSSTQGINLKVDSNNNAASEQWFFEPSDSSTVSSTPQDGQEYFIRSRSSGQYIEVSNSGDNLNTPIVQDYYSGAINQIFKVVSTGDGYFRLVDVASSDGKVIDYDFGSNVVSIYKDYPANTQQFQFVRNLNGTYSIETRYSNNQKCIEVPGSSVSTGTNLMVNNNSGGINQQWIFEPINASINSSATYTSDKDYLSTVTDASGSTVSYSYNLSKGTLTSESDAKGSITSYSYDPNNDEMTGVSKTVSGQTVSNNYTYQNDKLNSISHNGTTYNFAYDGFGNTTSVSAGSQQLISNSYLPNNGNLSSSSYGNGATVSYAYDNNNKVTQKSYNGTAAFQYTYDAEGNLYKSIDLVNNVTTQNTYDFINRLNRSDCSNGLSLLFGYDSKNRVSFFTSILNGITNKTEYIYGDPSVSGQKAGLMYGIKLNGTQQLAYTYNSIARLSNKTITGASNYGTTYSYLPGKNANTTTTQLASITNGSNTPLSYTYDANGNIETISEGGVLKVTYHYDELNELTREDNLYLNQTIDYAYDKGGNLTTKTTYPYTTGTLGTATHTDSYAYGDSNWTDKLTGYDGQTITYDAIGNPLSYVGGWNFTWQNGRQLATATNGTNTLSFKYNDSGIRTSKTVNGVTTSYYLNGSNIVTQITGSDRLDFFYDENGDLFGFNYNNTPYYYIRNGQNDIIGILDANGNQVVTYTYDSWGKPLSTTGSLASTVGAVNPFRYRGYYYDESSSLYYCNSRYYDPQTGRFINADSQVTTGSDLTAMNLFAYCGNNPVMRIDSDGHAWWHWAIAAAVVVVAAAVVVATAGGAAPALLAVAAVASGGFAATTASTVAAGVFIGASLTLGAMALSAAANSSSAQDFADQGNWGTVAATVGGGVIGGGSAYISTKDSSSTSKSVGKSFDPNGPKIQVGVDPKTLTPAKDLSTLNTQRLANAEKFGRDQAISVYRNGVIEDGHHRVANAIANGRSVDVVIFP